jgi:hypothetical protein
MIPRKLAILLVILFTSCSALAQGEADAERRLFELINQERTQRGLKPYEQNDKLTKAAREHSQLMANRKTLSHQFPGELPLRGRLGNVGLAFNTDGENVGYDSEVDGLHIAWMASPPHRANILKKEFTAVGIGVAKVGRYYYATQDFARTLPGYSANDAEKIISAAFDNLRQKSGARVLERIDDPRLRDVACRMAKADKLDTDTPRGFENVRNIVVYTSTEPQRLPSNMQKLADVIASGYSLGACYASSKSQPSNVYWVAFVTYF